MDRFGYYNEKKNSIAMGCSRRLHIEDFHMKVKKKEKKTTNMQIER